MIAFLILGIIAMLLFIGYELGRFRREREVEDLRFRLRFFRRLASELARDYDGDTALALQAATDFACDDFEAEALAGLAELPTTEEGT